MTLYELRLILDGLLSTEAVQTRFVPGLELVANLIAPLSAGHDDADDAEDAEDAEDADDAEDAEDADDAEDTEDDSESAQNLPRRGWNNRRLTGEPEGRTYLFRRASDGGWFGLHGSHVLWSADREAAEVRRGMRSACATAIGISTHAGSTIEVVDVESGDVVRRYANRRRVD